MDRRQAMLKARTRPLVLGLWAVTAGIFLTVIILYTNSMPQASNEEGEVPNQIKISWTKSLTDKEKAHEASRVLQRLHMRPGFTIYGITNNIARFVPKLPGPLGACDDQDECEDNAQEGCDHGCGTSQNPQPCGEGDVTNVEVNGTSCFARCADGRHVYIEICGVTP